MKKVRASTLAFKVMFARTASPSTRGVPASRSPSAGVLRRRLPELSSSAVTVGVSPTVEDALRLTMLATPIEIVNVT